MHHDIDTNGKITSIDFAYGIDFDNMSLEKIEMSEDVES
jgi:hypothetical protein